MRKKFSRLVSLVCLPLLACGGSDNNSKTVKVPDAKVFLDSAVANCNAAATYTLGTQGGASDTPEHAGSGSSTFVHGQDIQLLLNVNSDLLRFLLNAEFGAFGSGDIVPGTYPIAGDDLDANTCGICAFVYPKLFDGSGNVVAGYDFNNNLYLATAGTLVITTDTPPAGSGGSGTFTGSFSNLTFKHVNFANDGTQTYATDGCSTAIATGGPLTLPLKYKAPTLAATPELPVPGVLKHRTH